MRFPAVWQACSSGEASVLNLTPFAISRIYINDGKRKRMPDFVMVLLVVAAYFAIMKWLLPKLGVPT